jgi:hypothetical protein
MQFARICAASALAVSSVLTTAGQAQAATTVPIPADVGAKGCGLPPLNLSGMGLYNYKAAWTASNWANAGSTIPWVYSHVKQSGNQVLERLDATGAPELQAVQGTPARTSGLWQVDVTMPLKMREGVVVAPLWLYDNISKDEIDIEFVAARALTVSLHSWPGGVSKSQTVAVISNFNFSGRRLCLGINVHPTGGLIDILADGQVIYTWNRSKMSFFVNHPLRPWLELWAANPANTGLSAWTGKFAGFAAGDSMTLTVNGYSYTPTAF